MLCTLHVSQAAAEDEKSAVDAPLRDRAIAAIRTAMEHEQEWVKVHAAEFLLALGYDEGVKETYEKELKLHGDEPKYRIGIWRVLARANHNADERKAWVDKIKAVFLDPKSPDRLHATETLAKLGYRLSDDEISAAEQAALPTSAPLTPYAAWILLNSARPDRAAAEARLAALLQSPDVDTRMGAAYALRHQRTLLPATRQALSTALQKEPQDSKARVYLAAAAAVHTPRDENAAFQTELFNFLHGDKTDERVEAGRALAQIAGNADLPALVKLLDDPAADVRITAADAVLRIGRRVPHHLAALDWIVIALYALGMLSVGWYYSYRTKTREQFLLGDRKMRPFMVGLSLFAALISTISYLAWPGEMIKNGPMMLGQILAYPLVAIVIGWFIIPFIMRLKVTSAYEILDLRLGATVRTLGSTLFLLLRLFWMSVIVYATATTVLIPMLGLTSQSAPLICTTMALVAIGYTAMGGLRAAVITDVIQSAILFSAAVVAIVVITVSLGGVGAWWPHHWAAHWPEPVYGYSSDARVTLFGAMLATFTWFVCTSSSDQIAVQRYLSTKDAKAARSVLFVSLVSDCVVLGILAAVGLGLFAYFRAFPHLLPDSQTVLTDSDKLFSQFIVIGLPQGFTGLVVAGLLACAMSSLAAGINSTCSVISVDFVDRFRRHKTAETGQVRQLRYISVLVGAAVVLLSLFVNMVEGNLLEVCYKVVNLLTAPLAGLFFLAMFVPWAKGFGAIVGAVCGLAVVVAVNYWKEITGTQGISFLWAMPLSLVVEVGVGAVVSLLPIGTAKPMLTE